MARFRLRRTMLAPVGPKTPEQIAWEGFLFGGKPVPAEYVTEGSLLIAEETLAKSFLATLEDSFLNGTSKLRPVGLIQCEPIGEE